MVDENKLVSWIWAKFFQSLPINVKSQQLVRGTHVSRANILPTSYVEGSDFYETDRQIWYAAVGNNWIYKTGILQTTQTNLPTDLGLNDTGLLAYVSDYAHLLQWTGAGWQW